MRTLILCALLIAAAHPLFGQTPTIRGTDAASGISYALISAEGKVVDAATQPTPPPRLTAWCTRDASGKSRFELAANIGNAPDPKFIPPWRPTKESLFPPTTPRVQVTMEFLGYVKQKPVRRVWAYVDGAPDELKYLTPGAASSNMESIQFYLQYLRALPTLRLTLPTAPGAKTTVIVEFETSKWQAAIKAEALCSASGL